MLDEIGKAAGKAHPEPEPPMNTVVGLDGQETEEPNPADPDYLAALEERGDRLASDIVMRVLKVALAYDAIEYKTDAKAVARIRKAMAAGGIEMEGDDSHVYFWHALLRDDDDLQALTGAIIRMNGVTEEAVQEQVAAFPDNVPGT